MFGSFGMTEMLIIAGIAMLIFGPRQLPKLGRSLGQTLREIRRIPQTINEESDADDDE